MQNTLLVCSKTTRKYLPEYKNVFIVSAAPTKEILNLEGTRDSVVAIGGGATIDTAKILSKNPITCYPTTAAGSSSTSHSVCWNGQNKMSIKRMVPREVHVVEKFVENLPEEVKEYTTYDVISHCLDSLWSKNKTKKSVEYCNEALSILKRKHSNTELVIAGNIAGKAIEICPTTILHSLSYPLTSIYGIPHGKALGYLLPKVCKFMDFDLSSLCIYPQIEIQNLDTERVSQEAMKYKKIYDIEKTVNAPMLIDMLNESQS